MPDSYPADSVGLVEPQLMQFSEPLMLACGRALEQYQLAYETYGTLNAERTNAVLICHALSSNHHAAGYHAGEDKPGWWDVCIGPGKPIDTSRFFVVSVNNLGGCHGSTGPSSINPQTGQPWGPDFPPLRARDWVHAQERLGRELGVEQWAAIVGGSLGGMQAMRWSLEYPDKLRHCVVIASALKLSAQNIAFNEIARNAIRSDPEFHGGDYAQHQTLPKNGLKLARMIGHVTYLSDDLMGAKFGRELSKGDFKRGEYNPVEFEVESYLRYQGDKFSEVFDANTYILITRILDYFDLAREYQDDPVQAFSHALCKFMVISFTTDWRFSPARSREISDALIAAGKDVCYAQIDAPQGHDAFLLPVPRYLDTLGAYLQRVAEEVNS